MQNLISQVVTVLREEEGPAQYEVTLAERLHDAGIALRIEGERLAVSSPDGSLSDELIAGIRGHKRDLMKLVHSGEIRSRCRRSACRRRPRGSPGSPITSRHCPAPESSIP